MPTDVAPIGLEEFGAALAALSALSITAFGLVDATKAFWGGASNLGLGHIFRALAPFDPALDAALGAGRWRATVRANWIGGVPKTRQKAIVGALLKLGLSPTTAHSLAVGGRVSPEALAEAAGRLESGEELTEADLNVLGRMTASVEAVLDAAFELAEQQYRNVSRVLAGVFAIALALIARAAWATYSDDPPSIWVAFAVGVLAVPFAPLAKDLTSGLSAAAHALKTVGTLGRK